MSEVPVQVIVAAFQEERAADETLRALKQAKWEGLIGIQNAAVLRRDKKSKLHVKELKDWGGGKGAVAGGAIGAVVGILAGPGALAIGAAGALIGGLTAKLRDSGFSNDRLNTIGESLQPGTSAIVAVIEHKWVAQLEQEMAEAGADVATAAIAADVAEQLEAGREVALTALGTDEALAMGRVSTGEAGIEASSTVITEEGVTASDAVVTPEGAVAEQVIATDDAITYTIAAAVPEEISAEAADEDTTSDETAEEDAA
jgi:uncharacterized membrane protein